MKPSSVTTSLGKVFAIGGETVESLRVRRGSWRAVEAERLLMFGQALLDYAALGNESTQSVRGGNDPTGRSVSSWLPEACGSKGTSKTTNLN